MQFQLPSGACPATGEQVIAQSAFTYLPGAGGTYTGIRGGPGNYAAKSTRREITGVPGSKSAAVPGGAMADTGSGEGPRRSQGSRRARQQPGRPFRVHFSLTEQEFAALQDAAGRAGLARGAFAAQVVLAHVTGNSAGPEAPEREALRELVRAAGLVRRIG